MVARKRSIKINTNTGQIVANTTVIASTVGPIGYTGSRGLLGYTGSAGSGGGGFGGGPVVVSPTFKGALLSLSASESVSTSFTAINNFTVVQYDTTGGSLTSTASRFTIPAGVTKVRCAASIADISSVSDQLTFRIRLNGVDSYSTNTDIDSGGGDYVPGFTPVLSVIEGDYLEVWASAPVTRTIDTSFATWFSIEIVEGIILDQTINVIGYTGSQGIIGYTGSAGDGGGGGGGAGYTGSIGFTGSAGTNGAALTLATIQNASGSNVDFNIPTWAKRITVMYHGVSYGAATTMLIQIGTSAGFEASGYFSVYEGIATSGGTSSVAAATTGYGIVLSLGGSDIFYGQVILSHMGNNIWTITGSTSRDTTSDAVYFTSGSKALSDTLTQVRLTTATGSAFDAGQVNVLYE